MPAKPGLSASLSFVVTDHDTAESVGSGDVAVLSTPRVLAMVVAATMKALVGALDPNETTVGVQVQLEHVAATPVGADVNAEATVEKCAGRKVVFTVKVTDDRGLVAAGRVTRVVVDREAFLAKLG